MGAYNRAGSLASRNMYTIVIVDFGALFELASPRLALDAGDVGLIPGLGRSPRGGNGNSFQYSCLENSMNRAAWQARVHGVTKS